MFAVGDDPIDEVVELVAMSMEVLVLLFEDELEADGVVEGAVIAVFFD